MSNTFVKCACESSEHLINLTYFPDDKDFVYLEVHLRPHSFWGRVKNAIKYVFGHRSDYGDFEEFLLNKEKATEIKKVCEDFLDDTLC